MKKIIRLTERDLTRIVKRVLNEQEDYKNKTINLYKDKDNKNFLAQVKIDQLEDSDGKSYAWYETLTPKGDLKVYCAKDGIEFKTDGSGRTVTVYNKVFEDAVKKQMCTTNTKGVTVPKADFALTQPQTQQMGGGTLAERDLTRIVKRVINEQKVSETKRKFFDGLASQISSKLIGKQINFGKIGVFGDSSITIKKYVDRNHAINLEGKPINEFGLWFNVQRNEEDLYPGETKGTRIWSGTLEINGKFTDGKLSPNPTLTLYSGTGDNIKFDTKMSPSKTITWDMVGGADLWAKAANPQV